LRDRKKEFAIYIALGCKKKHLFWQIFLEVLIPSILALLLALTLGNMMTTRLSKLMITAELTRQQDSYDSNALTTNVFFTDYGPIYYDSGREILEWFIPEIGHEDMLEAFDISLTLRETGTFFILGLALIWLATSLAMIFIVNLNPKIFLSN